MTFQTVVKLASRTTENGVNGTNCVSGAGGGAEGVNLAATGREGDSGDMGEPNKSVSMLYLTNGGCVLSTVPLFRDIDDDSREART